MASNHNFRKQYFLIALSLVLNFGVIFSQVYVTPKNPITDLFGDLEFQLEGSTESITIKEIFVKSSDKSKSALVYTTDPTKFDQLTHFSSMFVGVKDGEAFFKNLYGEIHQSLLEFHFTVDQQPDIHTVMSSPINLRAKGKLSEDRFHLLENGDKFGEMSTVELNKAVQLKWSEKKFPDDQKKISKIGVCEPTFSACLVCDIGASGTPFKCGDISMTFVDQTNDDEEYKINIESKEEDLSAILGKVLMLINKKDDLLQFYGIAPVEHQEIILNGKCENMKVTWEIQDAYKDHVYEIEGLTSVGTSFGFHTVGKCNENPNMCDVSKTFEGNGIVDKLSFLLHHDFFDHILLRFILSKSGIPKPWKGVAGYINVDMKECYPSQFVPIKPFVTPIVPKADYGGKIEFMVHHLPRGFGIHKLKLVLKNHDKIIHDHDDPKVSSDSIFKTYLFGVSSDSFVLDRVDEKITGAKVVIILNNKHGDDESEIEISTNEIELGDSVAPKLTSDQLKSYKKCLKEEPEIVFDSELVVSWETDVENCQINKIGLCNFNDEKCEEYDIQGVNMVDINGRNVQVDQQNKNIKFSKEDADKLSDYSVLLIHDKDDKYSYTSTGRIRMKNNVELVKCSDTDIEWKFFPDNSVNVFIVQRIDPTEKFPALKDVGRCADLKSNPNCGVSVNVDKFHKISATSGGFTNPKKDTRMILIFKTKLGTDDQEDYKLSGVIPIDIRSLKCGGAGYPKIVPENPQSKILGQVSFAITIPDTEYELSNVEVISHHEDKISLPILDPNGPHHHNGLLVEFTSTSVQLLNVPTEFNGFALKFTFSSNVVESSDFSIAIENLKIHPELADEADPEFLKSHGKIIHSTPEFELGKPYSVKWSDLDEAFELMVIGVCEYGTRCERFGDFPEIGKSLTYDQVTIKRPESNTLLFENGESELLSKSLMISYKYKNEPTFSMSRLIHLNQFAKFDSCTRRTGNWIVDDSRAVKEFNLLFYTGSGYSQNFIHAVTCYPETKICHRFYPYDEEIESVSINSITLSKDAANSPLGDLIIAFQITQDHSGSEVTGIAGYVKIGFNKPQCGKKMNIFMGIFIPSIFGIVALILIIIILVLMLMSNKK